VKTIIAALIITILTLPQLALSADQPAEKAAAAPGAEKSAETKTDKPVDTSYVGTVAEAMIGGSYLYLKMDLQGEEVWLATNPTYPGGKVEVGEKLEFSGGVEMKGFKSKSLDRTFDKILFVTKIRKFDTKPIDDFEHVPADQLHSKYAKENQPAAVPAPGEIAKPENGITIEELFNKKDSLKDKDILFRARVMKFSKNIMKKNWVTLQDGTGTRPDDQIVATSSEIVNPGETVTVKGILRSDVDLGAGYFYKVLIEHATFTK
jgi:hypothetical protein